MKIYTVTVHNQKPPGEEWWTRAQAHPDEPLIHATIKMTISWEEYNNLLDGNQRGTDGIPSQFPG